MPHWIGGNMPEYSFALSFKLKDGESSELYLDALFEAGCDDSTVGIGAKGSVTLSFIREAKDVQTALVTAIRDVKKAIPHGQLEQAGPDLLNLSELAFLFGFTKQNMRKYARGEVASVTKDFPLPVITGKTSYWHCARVAKWLQQQSNTNISDDMVNALHVIWCLNQANEYLQRPDPTMIDDFTQFLQQVA